MKFKTDRQREEYESDKLDPKMRMLLQMIDFYSVLKTGLEITVTEIYRTQEEQDAIYARSEKYQAKPWLSVHQIWKGADIRVTDYRGEDVANILGVLESIPYRTRGKQTAIRHDVGKGDHIHIQV